MSILRRLNLENRYYFVTQTIEDRKKIFLDENNVKILKEDFNYYINKYKAGIIAYVIMPEHLHFIIRVIGKYDLSNHMYDFKIHTAKKINIRLGSSGQLWQKRFYDHVIRNEEDFIKHIDYIYYNPVKHNLVSRSEDYNNSTYKLFVKKGYYELGWGYREPGVLRNYNLE